MAVDEKAIRAAVRAREAYIVERLNNMTLKSCRQMLEADMGLEAGALKPFKKLLGDQIDRLIAKQHAAAETAPASSGKKKVNKQKKGGDDEERGSKPGKRQKREGKEREEPERDQKPAKPSGPRQYSRTVEKLRAICKAATITIPPTLYVKNKSDEQLQAALEALLEKHGLDAHAGEREIQKARAKLQVQRDLDGIDASNIIQGGRGRRAAAPVSYKQLVQPPSDSEEEDDDEAEQSSGDDEVVMSDSDAPAESQDAAPAKAAEPSQAEPVTQGGAGKVGSESESDSDSEDNASSSSSSSSDEDDDGSKPSAAVKVAPAPARQKTKSQGGKGSQENVPAKVNASLEDSEDDKPAAMANKRRALERSEDDE